MRFKEFIIDSFFYGMGIGVVVLLGYLLYLGWDGMHPQPKHHWSQGPQDPIPTE